MAKSLSETGSGAGESSPAGLVENERSEGRLAMRVPLSSAVVFVGFAGLVILWSDPPASAQPKNPFQPGAFKGFFKRPNPSNDQRASTNRFNDSPTPEQLAFFEKKIRPVLVDQCYQCHSAESEKIRGGLVLDTKLGLRTGGDSGPAIVPGNPDASPLIRAIRYRDEGMKMPPKQKLAESVIADFEAWVRMGAPDPRDEMNNATVKANGWSADELAKAREHWSFQPPRQQPPPTVHNRSWAETAIDRFVLAKLESVGLEPVADADQRTLIRRLTLDLIGLPPTPEEVEAFLADSSPNAWEKVVDRLLASPAFGERWGRHWLDVARFAESSGKTANFNYPHAWRYRDYVIAAFNKDKPYDQFIREQIAGDLMPTNDDKVKAERIVATGFLAIGPKALNERNTTQFEMDMVDEQIDVISQAFLGLTIACARCHDHKFDPIPQREYYAMAGILRSSETCYGTIRFIQSQRPSPLIELPKGSAPSALTRDLSPSERESIEKSISDIRKSLSESRDAVRNIFTLAQLSQLQSRLSLYDAEGKPRLLAMGVRERFRTVNSPVYVRGEVNKPGEVVPRGVPQIFPGRAPRVYSGSGRRELADWIASKNNPLTARVMVNRVWAHLFGRGLAPLDNFGLAAPPPSHPELLDYLAVEFMNDGWSVKRLIKRMVLSHAYRLGSQHSPQAYEKDPDNVLLWRMAPRRLEAEVLRDSILALSGLLERTPPLGSSVARAGEGPSNRRFGFAAADPQSDRHRSVYLPMIVNELPEALEIFDGADPGVIVPERSVTNVPTQGLYLLNNSLVMTAADATADHLLRETSAISERVRAAYLKFYCRPPSETEMQAAEKFIADYSSAALRNRVPSNRVERNAWSAFCQALFASAEFLYRR